MNDNEMWIMIAGFFQGDGHVSIIKNNSYKKYRGKIQHRLLVVLTNYNSEFLIEINEFLKSQKIKNWISPKDKPHRLSIEYTNAKSFLENIIGYLIIKKYEAKIAIDFQNHKERWKMGHPLTEKELAIREDYYNMVKKLK